MHHISVKTVFGKTVAILNPYRKGSRSYRCNNEGKGIMKSVYVGNLPYATTDNELKALFEPFGTVYGARVKTDRETGRPLGYGFIQMEDEEAAKAIETAEAEAAKQGKKLEVAHYDMRFLKPIDTDILEEVATKFKHVITVEDGVISGGLGSAVLEFMSEKEHAPMIHRVGMPDKFVEHGTVAQLRELTGMDFVSIAKLIGKLS